MTPRLASLAACLAGLVFAILLFGAADRAEAHASFLASDPAAGLVTGEPPRTVVLRFNEPVVLTSARLTTPSGERFDLPLSSPAAAAHALAVPPQSEQGTYSLSWRVVSEDGHPVGGAFVYSVGRVSATLAVEAETPLAVRVLLWLSRLMTACGATFGVGGAAVLAFLAGNRGTASASRRTIDWALATGALGAAVSIGLQGLDAKGISLAGLTDVATWTTALVQTTWGTSALLNIAAVSAAALSGRRGSEVASRVLAGAAVAAVGAAFATSGHAATAPPETLSRTRRGPARGRSDLLARSSARAAARGAGRRRRRRGAAAALHSSHSVRARPAVRVRARARPSAVSRARRPLDDRLRARLHSQVRTVRRNAGPRCRQPRVLCARRARRVRCRPAPPGCQHRRRDRACLRRARRRRPVALHASPSRGDARCRVRRDAR